MAKITLYSANSVLGRIVRDWGLAGASEEDQKRRGKILESFHDSLPRDFLESYNNVSDTKRWAWVRPKIDHAVAAVLIEEVKSQIAFPDGWSKKLCDTTKRRLAASFDSPRFNLDEFLKPGWRIRIKEELEHSKLYGPQLLQFCDEVNGPDTESTSKNREQYRKKVRDSRENINSQFNQAFEILQTKLPKCLYMDSKLNDAAAWGYVNETARRLEVRDNCVAHQNSFAAAACTPSQKLYAALANIYNRKGRTLGSNSDAERQTLNLLRSFVKAELKIGRDTLQGAPTTISYETLLLSLLAPNDIQATAKSLNVSFGAAKNYLNIVKDSLIHDHYVDPYALWVEMGDLVDQNGNNLDLVVKRPLPGGRESLWLRLALASLDDNMKIDNHAKLPIKATWLFCCLLGLTQEDCAALLGISPANVRSMVGMTRAAGKGSPENKAMEGVEIKQIVNRFLAARDRIFAASDPTEPQRHKDLLDVTEESSLANFDFETAISEAFDLIIRESLRDSKYGYQHDRVAIVHEWTLPRQGEQKDSTFVERCKTLGSNRAFGGTSTVSPVQNHVEEALCSARTELEALRDGLEQNNCIGDVNPLLELIIEYKNNYEKTALMATRANAIEIDTEMP
jgi:hypothetical protein